MQKFQLSIPEPCHENWQQMTPTDQGRFCNACAKEVIDFSIMTDSEVLNYFTNLTHEKVCGRALPDQLNRTITMPKEPKKRLFWYWNYMVMFFMFFGKGNSTNAQGGIKRVSMEQLVKKPASNLENALKGKVGGPFINNIKLITGKITNGDGMPVSFATIKIKGSNTGVSADANGAFSIKVLDYNTVLEISAVGFKYYEVSTASETEFNIILTKEEIVFLGGMVSSISIRNSDDYYGVEDKPKSVAVITVRDENSGKAIDKATLIITKNSVSKSYLADKKGVYKIKGIKPYEQYNIEIKADGYEANKLTITETEFKNRKQSWEVLLRRAKKNLVLSTASPKPGKVAKVRMGAVNGLLAGASDLYVVDDVITKDINSINPDDIEELTVLQAAAAYALFGSKAANGAIVITTKKQKVKNLDTVLINSFYTHGCPRTTMGATSIITTANEKDSALTRKVSDSLKILTTKISGALKVYPNPAKKGSPINIELQLKKIGEYRIQIIDAAGRIVLQKQINATNKEFIEQLMTDERWSSGMYYISLLDSKNQLINKRGFIFQ